MTGPVKTFIEKTGSRPPALSECQSDSLGDNIHELAAADRTRNILQEKIFQNLLEINTRSTEWIPTSPLQRTDKPPKFEDIYVPPTIREDLEKTEQRYRHKVDKKRTEEKHSTISSARDLFYKKEQAVRYIFLQGEAGHGKTEYCRNLVKHWCRAKQGNGKKEGLSEWESGLDEFDFVFMIMLRHVQKSRTSLVDMICSDLFKHYGSCHDDIKKLIKSGNCRSLFIVDGLDEWKIPPEIMENLVNTALPNIDCTSNSTFLFTYRPWKHADLAGEIQSCDRVIEVKGFDEDGKRLAIKNVLKTLTLPDSSKEIIEQKSDEIIKVSKKSGLESILRIPILVPVFVTLYHEGKFEEKSMTSFYIRLVQYFIKLAKEKKTVNDSMSIDIVEKTKISESNDRKIVVPDILESPQNETFKDFRTALIKLGEIAYNDLISSETSLVFRKEELKALGPSVLDFALNVGLLNQCQAPGCFDEENVSLNFFHKSVQEFLAATYVVCQGEVVATSTLCEKLSSVKVILDLSDVLKFVSGLSPSLGGVTSRHVVEICEKELEFGLNSKDEYEFVFLFNLLQYRCYLEVRNNQVVEKTYPVNRSEKVKKRKVDIQYQFTAIDLSCYGVSLNEFRDLLDDVNVVTDALYVQTEHRGTENKKLEKSVNNFLKRTESLRHLILHCPSSDHAMLQSMNKDLTLRTIDLRGVTLSCECFHQLVTSVISSRQLQTLILKHIDIKNTATDSSQGEVIYQRKKTSFAKQSPHKQKQAKTFRKWVDLWQILPECPNLTTLHIGLDPLEDTFGRDALYKILPSLKHLRYINFKGRFRRFGVKDPDCSDSDSIIKTIIQSPQLEKIKLSYLYLTERLTQGMLELQTLSLKYVTLDSKCLDYILQLPDLEELELICIEIPDTDLCMNVVLPNLQIIFLLDINFGDGVLELTSECKTIQRITLSDITMSESGWRRLFTSLPTFHHNGHVGIWSITMSADSWMTFVTSILEQDQSVDVELWDVNIDDESVRMITSCPHVKVTANEKDNEKRTIEFITKV